jgi:hypothetical protein
MDALADVGGVVRLVVVAVALAMSACKPLPAPIPPTPYDAGDAGGRTPCETDRLIGPARLIRGPDGQPVSVPCVDGGV